MFACLKRISNASSACTNLRLSLVAAALLLFYASPAQAIGSITVMADSGLGVAIAEIARNYSRASNLVVNTSFASQKSQEAQINEGGAADILITSDQAWIDRLKASGLVDVYSQVVVARNRLALVGPVGTPLELAPGEAFPTTSLIRHMNFEPGFVIGHPEALAEGIYAKEALSNLGVYQDIEEYTLYVKSLPQMMEMVANQGDYGLFFYSTTIARRDLRVLALLPETVHKPIQYFAVVIAGENMNEARKFIDYLKGADAKVVLMENGFSSGS